MVEIRCVASHTGVGRVIVVARVAVVAIIGEWCMGSCEGIKVIVVFEKCWHPVRGS